MTRGGEKEGRPEGKVEGRGKITREVKENKYIAKGFMLKGRRREEENREHRETKDGEENNLKGKK